MSSPLSAIPGIEQIIQVFIADYSDYKVSIITSSMFRLGATAILWWEYLITFDNEVEYFWNRYLTLFSRTFDTASTVLCTEAVVPSVRASIQF
ncbi:hypothetical protein EW026_g4469 [Hermanssonia centrifuga]|uniref:DUF6533 domain-containing protein n=1 Tax=Hermanssonia centrifuga TaxID=98765 RepID=A0A4S4KGZ0_9APHY|nr:hypothetical protein EW026_g4469 [Hermanssonia centrifuga]